MIWGHSRDSGCHAQCCSEKVIALVHKECWPIVVAKGRPVDVLLLEDGLLATRSMVSLHDRYRILQASRKAKPVIGRCKTTVKELHTMLDFIFLKCRFSDSSSLLLCTTCLDLHASLIDRFELMSTSDLDRLLPSLARLAPNCVFQQWVKK